jgi:hypothetical protein
MTEYGRRAVEAAKNDNFNHSEWDYDKFDDEDRAKLYEVRYSDRPNYDLPDDQDYVPAYVKWDEAGPEDMVKRCTAQTRKGHRCKKAARRGYDTCEMHGAGTEEKPGGVQKHRRSIYKLKKNTDLQKKAEKYLNDERLDDIDQELAQLMALYEVAAEDENVSRKALVELQDKIAKNKKRKKDVEAQSSLTIKEVHQLQSAMIQIFKQYVPEERQEAAKNELRNALQLGEG